LRSPALISTCSKAGCYAVLASLSGRYPPFEGRSPTCYSPVRHSTNPLRGFRVRLACVRHAASVDSEPGSNSHVNSLFHPSIHHLRGSLGTSQLLTRLPVDLALALFVCRCCSVVRRIAATPTKLTLDGSYLLCLHALSSFQRTGTRPQVGDPTDRPTWPVLGEPSEVTSASNHCQSFFCRRTATCCVTTASGLSSPGGRPLYLPGWRPSSELIDPMGWDDGCQPL
jgi:hypothetical protein